MVNDFCVQTPWKGKEHFGEATKFLPPTLIGRSEEEFSSLGADGLLFLSTELVIADSLE